MSNSQYIPFLVKSLIGAAIAAMLGLFLIEAATIEAEKSISRIKNQIVMPNYFPGQGKLSAGGQSLAYKLQEMSPERRKELIALLREIVVELRPFAVELWPLLMESCTEQSGSLAPERSL